MKHPRISGRYALATAAVLVLGIPAAAVAVGEGRAIMGGERNPRSGDLSRETEIIADNGTYGTRQSNKRDGDGGGAIYGCRSNLEAEACVRANNLKGGRAFDFETVGKEAGRITTGDAAAPPFSTNATGTVANLSADKLDGRDSAEFATGALLFARVLADGSLAGDRGATGASRQGNTNTYIVTFNRNVSACSYGATASGGNNADKPSPSVAGGGNDNNVRVDFGQAAGPTPFHLQVIC
jgi:hypothetical protein